MDHPTWIGRTLGGRYRIEALLGQGGMSAVYKASDPNLKRVVAVKLIHSHLSADPSFVQRFESEAAAVASLRHPNIVQVFDFNNDSGAYYMVLEFIPGETLHDRLKRLAENQRKLSLPEALKYTLDISEAAAYAHRRGMIHRDIKPANIMLDVHGQAILMDFGIVKILGGESHTSTGAVVGTASYMPPEVIRGETADQRSDIYSLGVTLYEMLSGRPPFVADSAMTLMMMHLNDPVPDVRGFRPDVPAEVVALLEKCLAKQREERFQSAEELSAGLKRLIALLEGQPTTQARSQPASGQAAAETVVRQGGVQARPEPAAAAQSSVGPQSGEPASGGQKIKPNLTRYLIAGGALALLILVAAGVLLIRNISARNAPPGGNPPPLETFTPTTHQTSILPVAVADTPTVPSATSAPQAIITATSQSVIEVQHSQFPAESFNEGKINFDVQSRDTAPEKRAPYGDSYDLNIFERPFLQDMTYLPELDIATFSLRQTDLWYYVSINLIGSDPNHPAGIWYGVELDQDRDGIGDYIIVASPPYPDQWSAQGVRVYADENHDTAGDSPSRSDAPFTADGYETLIHDGSQSSNADPDLVWVRHYAERSIQFAFKRSWAGESFMFGILTDAGLKDVARMDYNDRFSFAEAGSPVRSHPNYPLQAIFGVDNTCRGAAGFTPKGYEPRICAALVPPTVTPTLVTATPTPDPLVCQPPPEGCPPDAPNWWPAPHCACSLTPYNP